MGTVWPSWSFILINFTPTIIIKKFGLRGVFTIDWLIANIVLFFVNKSLSLTIKIVFTVDPLITHMIVFTVDRDHSFGFFNR